MRVVAIVPFIFILFFNSLSHTVSQSIKYDAQSWFNSYVKDQPIDPYDLGIVTNLIYLSYLRSQATLVSQEAGLMALETVWKSWQNITQIRRNPSKPIPYVITHEQEESVQEFFKFQKHHYKMSLTYLYSHHMIYNEEIILGKHARAALDSAKQMARKTCMDGVLDIKKHTGDLYTYLTLASGKRSFISQLSNKFFSYLPLVALSSFVKADQSHIACSEQGFKSLMAIQEAGNYVWSTLETARAEWYYELYKHLYDYLGAYEPRYRLLMFCEWGYVNHLVDALPMIHPDELTLDSIHKDAYSCRPD